MSFWFFGRKRQGRRSLYSLDLYWPLIIIAFTVTLAYLLPWIIALKKRLP